MIKMMDLQKNLNHPHIAKFFYFVPQNFELFPSGDKRRVTYAVLEYLAGTDLLDYLSDHRYNKFMRLLPNKIRIMAK